MDDSYNTFESSRGTLHYSQKRSARFLITRSCRTNPLKSGRSGCQLLTAIAHFRLQMS